jgi:RNA polymerase sigma-70 factor (ECF subfamily)
VIVPVDEVQTALLRASGPAASSLPRAEVSAMRAARARSSGRLLAFPPEGEPRRDQRRQDPACVGDHIDRLYRAARGMCVSRKEAEDLVQDTIARALKEPRVIHSDDDIGYLLRVLRTTFLSDRPRRVDEPESIERLPAAQPEAGLGYSVLYRAVAFLPDHFRDALIAVDLTGLSYGEAACALGVDQATLATRLHRGRQRVAEMLEGGVASKVRTRMPPGPSGN